MENIEIGDEFFAFQSMIKKKKIKSCVMIASLAKWMLDAYFLWRWVTSLFLLAYFL